MAGILNNKTRVMDTLITLEGRRQLASGKLRIEYVSFTDGATFYQADVVSGSSDASTRLYLEQSHLPQDQITFEADDSGRLKPFKNHGSIQMKDGQILAYSFDALTASVLTGSNQNVKILRGSEFASTADALLTSSIENFVRLYAIGTRDKIFEDDGFSLGNKKVEFVIHNDRPISDQTHHATNINYLESLFNDVRLSRIRNFKFLPPVNKISERGIDKSDSSQTWRRHLGHYRPWGSSKPLSGRQLEHELAHYERIGYSRTITFEPTSRDNRLVGQFFEIDHDVIRKLDVIDFGKYTYKGKVKHAFFIGKVLVDENETHTFVHLFTLVFG